MSPEPPAGVLQIELNGDQTNAYVVGDVLVDAGSKGKQAQRALAAVAGREVLAHLITHAHPDHAGGSQLVVDRLGVPVWAGRGDAEAIEAGTPVVGDGIASGLLRRFGRFAPQRVERRLQEGDAVADGFTVLEAPGHTPGHLALWRESDRTLLAIDAFANMNPFTRRRGLQLLPKPLASDVAQMKESVRRLAALEPAVVHFGHGAPLRDPAALKAFAGSL